MAEETLQVILILVRYCTNPNSRFCPYFLLYPVDEGSELGDLYQFSISDNRWTDLTQISSGPPPSQRTDHCSASSDVAFFVFGGLQLSFSLGDLWQYDVFKLEWKGLHETGRTKQPPARCRCSLAYAADQLFLTGGYDYQGEYLAHEKIQVWLNLVNFFVTRLSSEVDFLSFL